MNDGVLKPHKEQDGWVYVRVSRTPQPDDVHLSYNDSAPSRRIISSRRVEEAVETADFLKRCKDERLCVTVGHQGAKPGSMFSVFSHDHGPMFGATLREAYYRYHQAVDK